jgi:hypothetical protein
VCVVPFTELAAKIPTANPCIEVGQKDVPSEVPTNILKRKRVRYTLPQTLATIFVSAGRKAGPLCLNQPILLYCNVFLCRQVEKLATAELLHSFDLSQGSSKLRFGKKKKFVGERARVR